VNPLVERCRYSPFANGKAEQGDIGDLNKGKFETGYRKISAALSAGAVFRALPFSSFGLASDFDIRVSDFLVLEK
jgi:hypothetical protein